VGTDLLFLDNSYERRFKARVVAVEDNNVVLDRTLFYPRGGGQMADTGELHVFRQPYRVIGVEKRGDVVHHTVDGRPPRPGDDVDGEIDWDHRYTMMRTHTALHVLCGVIFRRYGAQVTGCQMYPDRARMDFTLDDLSKDRVEDIARLSNEAITSGLPVRARWVARREAEMIPALIRTKINLVPRHIDPIRVVEIQGLDLQADGGTHVANTLEVGGIRITKTENKGRENRRIEIVLLPPVMP
jgi:misacylated tRNA(Ala) deacylase